MPDSSADVSRMVDRRMALAREWDELVEQVRKINGFEDFLKPPRLETLLPAAANGPVVVVNVSRWRCDALIVTTEGIRVVELPGLTAKAAAQRTVEYLQALHTVDEPARTLHLAHLRIEEGDHTPESYRLYTVAKQALLDAQRALEKTLGAVMEWLWDEIAEPVLTALNLVDTPAPGHPWPRVWWCPTGPLTLLPLHAAGYHMSTSDSPRRTVLDRVVSSYTPTVRALLEARKPVAADASQPRLLVVAVPEAPGETPLASVTRELDLLKTRFADRHAVLANDAATSQAVRAELPRHRWVHFSCHGNQDLTDPSRGGLRLYDGVLAIADISGGQYHGDFAFLSACKTATGGLNLPDEAITLAAALHYTGYRHVVGTLWSVYDVIAADVAEGVYTALTSNGEFKPAQAAQALHDTLRHLRDVQRAPLSAWTPFTHTGP